MQPTGRCSPADATLPGIHRRPRREIEMNNRPVEVVASLALPATLPLRLRATWSGKANRSS
jgi:hypothetical protein